MIAALLLAGATAAAPVIEVSSARGAYVVEVDATIDVPRPVVWKLLTDYQNLDRLSDSIRRSGVVERAADGTVVVDTFTHTCFGPFCRTLRHRQRVTETPVERIVSVTDAAHSDFADGRAEWLLHDAGSGTRIVYLMRVRPTIFVPPLIGPRMVRYGIRREVRALLAGLERSGEGGP